MNLYQIKLNEYEKAVSEATTCTEMQIYLTHYENILDLKTWFDNLCSDDKKKAPYLITHWFEEFPK